MKQIMLAFPKNEHFLSGGSGRIRGLEMFLFWKIWRALFSCYLHFKIHPFALLLTSALIVT